MVPFRTSWILFFLLLFGKEGIAQVSGDSIPVYSLPSSTIADTAYHQCKGFSRSYLAAHPYETLPNLLLYQTSGFLKTYGPGGLGTVSFRGASSSQTQVCWEGFSLQNAGLGMIDLNLLSGSLLSPDFIQTGGGGQNPAGGGIGGTLNFTSTPFFQEDRSSMSLSLHSRTGSFGQSNQGITFSQHSSRFSAKIIAFRRREDNEFPFHNSAQWGSPLETQKNSDLHQNQILGSWLMSPGKQKKIRISGSGWWAKTQRGLPSPMTNPPTGERQTDQSLRTKVGLHYLLPNHKFEWAAAAFLDSLRYTHPTAGLDSRSMTSTFSTYFSHEALLLPSKTEHHYWEAITQVRVSVEHASSAAFPDPAARTRWVLFHQNSLIPKNHPYTFWAIKLRQEFVGGKPCAVEPGLSGEWTILDKKLGIRLLGNVGRIQRLPSLNDLFWTPGGNPGLKPEIAWSGDWGIHLKPSTPSLPGIFSMDLTVFARKTRNWIQWAPSDTTGYWTAQNLDKVFSQGLDAHMEFTPWVHHPKNKYYLSGFYTFAKTFQMGGPFHQKQLIYTPLHQAKLWLMVDPKGPWKFGFGQNYTSRRFTQSDNAQWVKGYSTAEAQIMYQIGKTRKWGELRLDISNLWNARYQAIQWRAMPGRSFSLELDLNFGHTWPK